MPSAPVLSYRREARHVRIWDVGSACWRAQQFVTLHIKRDGREIGTASVRTSRPEGARWRGRVWKDDWQISIPGCPRKLPGAWGRDKVLAALKPRILRAAANEGASA